MMKKIFFVAILIVFILDHVFSNVEISLLPGVNLQNAILFICSVFLLITEVASGRIIKKPIPTLLICAFIIIWCCASFFYGRLSGVVKPPPLIDHLRDFKSQLIVPVVFFILGFLLSDTETESRANLVVIIIVFSIINFVSLTNLFGVSGGYDIQESNRFRTVLGNPNKVAYYFCLLLPFIYHLFCYYRNIAVKIFFISLLVSSAVFIMLSGSRGGFICMAIILLYIMLINRNYAFLAMLMAVSPIVLWFLWDNANIGVTFERFAPLLSGKMESSTTGRFAIWGALLDVYTADFFTVLYGIGASLITSVGLKSAPHNMYLKVLVEYGLVGFGIFGIFLLRIFLSIISRRRSAGSDLMPLVLLSSLVICIAWCFTTLVGMIDMVSFTYGSALAYYLHYCKPQVSKQSATRPQFIHPVEAT